MQTVCSATPMPMHFPIFMTWIQRVGTYKPQGGINYCVGARLNITNQISVVGIKTHAIQHFPTHKSSKAYLHNPLKSFCYYKLSNLRFNLDPLDEVW